MGSTIERAKVLEANIKVHSAISENYNKDSHWRPENLVRVRQHIERLRKALPNVSEDKCLLDIGCGTGFIINLAHDLFKRVDGVDITEAMLNKVDLKPGNIHLKIAEAENTGFADESMDMVTAYSFLDHLYDIEPVFKEVYRVLKPEGIFYSDLNPNRDFWETISGVKKTEDLHGIVCREVDMLDQGDSLSNNIGLDKQLMQISEPGKSSLKGFKRSELQDLAASIGFSKINISYDWFLGQADLIHNHSVDDLNAVEGFLNRALPLTSNLFKYLRIELVK